MSKPDLDALEKLLVTEAADPFAFVEAAPALLAMARRTEELERQVTAATSAIGAVLDRIQSDPDVRYLLGPGSDVFRRLVNAEAAITGDDPEAVEATRVVARPPVSEPEVVRLWRQVGALRGTAEVDHRVKVSLEAEANDLEARLDKATARAERAECKRDEALAEARASTRPPLDPAHVAVLRGMLARTRDMLDNERAIALVAEQYQTHEHELAVEIAALQAVLGEEARGQALFDDGTTEDMTR